MKLFVLFLLSLMSCMGVSCESTPSHGGAAASAATGGSEVPDHAPRYDYWQNGGGACCPAHAEQFKKKGG